MPGTFGERIDLLEAAVGEGRITAGCEVNQPYAQNQHQSFWFKHPHGGRAFYLGGPLLENVFGLLESIARGVITSEGSAINRHMIDTAETMARYVLENAPKETGRLSTSGHPWVRSERGMIYDRPPLSPRERD